MERVRSFYDACKNQLQFQGSRLYQISGEQAKKLTQVIFKSSIRKRKLIFEESKNLESFKRSIKDLTKSQRSIIIELLIPSILTCVALITISPSLLKYLAVLLLNVLSTYAIHKLSTQTNRFRSTYALQILQASILSGIQDQNLVQFIFGCLGLVTLVLVFVAVTETCQMANMEELLDQVEKRLITQVLQEREKSKKLSKDFMEVLASSNNAANVCVLFKILTPSEIKEKDPGPKRGKILLIDESDGLERFFEEARPSTVFIKADIAETIASVTCRLVSQSDGIQTEIPSAFACHRTLYEHLCDLEILNENDKSLAHQNFKFEAQGEDSEEIDQNCTARILLTVTRMSQLGLYLLRITNIIEQSSQTPTDKLKTMPGLRRIQRLKFSAEMFKMDCMDSFSSESVVDANQIDQELAEMMSQANNPTNQTCDTKIYNDTPRLNYNIVEDNAILLDREIGMENGNNLGCIDRESGLTSVSVAKLLSNIRSTTSGMTDITQYEKKKDNYARIDQGESVLVVSNSQQNFEDNDRFQASLQVFRPKSQPNTQSFKETPRDVMSNVLSIQKSTAQTNDQILVFQIIHDLRLPLEVQNDKISDTLKIIEKNQRVLSKIFNKNNNFRTKRSVKDSLDKLQVYLNLDKSLFQINRKSSSQLTELTVKNEDKVELIEAQGLHLHPESSPRPLKPLQLVTLGKPDDDARSLENESKEIYDKPISKKDSMQSQNFQRVFFNSAPDKEVIEQKEQSQKSPSSMEGGNTPKFSQHSLQNFDGLQSEKLSNVDSYGDQIDDNISERGEGEKGSKIVNSCYTFKENQNKQNDFKRKFGGNRQLKSFCDEMEIEILKEPIKSDIKFGTTLAMERLFIESQRNKIVKFDFMQKKFKTDVIKDKDNIRPLLKGGLQSARQMHERISEIQGHLMSAIRSHRSNQALNVQSDFEKEVSRRISQKIQLGKYAPKRISSFQVAPVNQDIVQGSSILNDQEMRKFLESILNERKDLIKIAEKTQQFYAQFKGEFEQIEAQSKKTMIYLKDLLDYAQMKNNSFSIVNEYFTLGKVIEETFNLNKKFANDKNINLLGPLYNDKQDSVFFQRLYGDNRRYLQVLVNFVNNAIKFTPSGGTVSILLEVISVKDLENRKRLEQIIEEDQGQDSSSSQIYQDIPDKEVPDSSQSEEQKVPVDLADVRSDQSQTELLSVQIDFKIIVRDTGIGISQENQTKLFQNFSKLEDIQKQNKSGVGLGLTISRDLVHAFGGTISFGNENRKGTDFVINLSSKSRITQEEHTKFVKKPVNFESLVANKNNRNKSLQDDEQYSQQMESSSHSEEEKSDSSCSFAPSNSEYIQESLTSLRDLQEHEQQNKRLNSLNSRRCLIANDTLFLLNQLEMELKKQFDHVELAIDGQQAVDHVLAHKVGYFSLIILDINMPNKGGVEACQEIQNYFNQSLFGSKGQQEQRRPSSTTSFRMKKPSTKRRQTYSSGFRFESIGKNTENEQIKKNSTKTTKDKKPPKIFAVTSDIDQAKLDLYLQSGFTDVYNSINGAVVRQMLKVSGLYIRKKSVISSSYSFDISLSSQQRISRDENENSPQLRSRENIFDGRD